MSWKKWLRPKAQQLVLLFWFLLVCSFVIEMGYRILDPFPFFSKNEINSTEHGNLTEYDQTLGWKGVPSGKAEFITKNNKVWLQHNRDGFRDVEHDDFSDKKPSIVFLGDSFTWGYEVEFDEMFVNRQRDLLPNYTIFNLAHRGYGTDLELLTFKHWHYDGPLQWVVLMFSENDANDNNARFRNRKPKPMYQLVENELVLTGVPVPKLDVWMDSRRVERTPVSWRTKLKRVLLHSHFLHDIYFRYGLIRSSKKGNRRRRANTAGADLSLTSRILQKLKDEVEGRGAKLVVIFIPSKREIQQLDDSTPYQIKIADLCQKLGIEHLDLAPNFKMTWYRAYYRMGMHWNSHGHQVAADVIYNYLSRAASS